MTEKVLVKKLLRRCAFLREREYNQFILPKAYKIGYHRAKWSPLTLEETHKRVTFETLKGVDFGTVFYGSKLIDKPSTAAELVARKYLNVHQSMLYNINYIKWHWKFVDDIQIRATSRYEWEHLGEVTLERDYYVSKIG